MFKPSALDLKLLLFTAIFLSLSIFLATLPPIPQDEAYHNFADKRTYFGIPNFFDVVSNVPFFLGGLYGFYVMLWKSKSAFIVADDQKAWWVLFMSSSCVAVGSSYYHWEPDTFTLFWDRLPMTITFMSIVSILITERIDRRVGNFLFLPLQFIGILSVVWWLVTELFWIGDLRLYVLKCLKSVKVDKALTIILTGSCPSCSSAYDTIDVGHV